MVTTETGEPVRLVIWDLDDTFWTGTLSEAGMTWRSDHAEIVKTLSQRGIINSVCSRNDAGQVEPVLRRHGMDEYFVFKSISWDSKGPRLKALVEAVQLRPQSILFIDDNPMNRAEAGHFVPGLQVADETIVPRLLDDPRLAGKADPAMTRLAQYRLLEKRQADLTVADGDTTGFLHASGITVEIEHDLALHEDRAIELINRTNQLNFTKRRLPEDQEAARRDLRAMLARHTVQAGLLRVRDRYGDYGYCGLYIQASDQSQPRAYLMQFAFSCRILGMGIETWLYQRLNRPILKVAGEVLTDVLADRRTIDWVSVRTPGFETPAGEAAKPLDYVLVRGGCDMRALGHYFAAASVRLIDEAAALRNGSIVLTCSSLLAAQACHEVPADLIRDAAPFGFLAEDFHSLIGAPPTLDGGTAVWLLNLHFEQPIPVLRHRATGLMIPASIPGATGQMLHRLVAAPETSGIDPELMRHIRAHFDVVGLVSDDLYAECLSRMLSQASDGVRVFIVLANEVGRTPEGTPRDLAPMRRRNTLTREVAQRFANTELLAPAEFMSPEAFAALPDPHHYDRLVYFRMFQHVMSRVAAAVA